MTKDKKRKEILDKLNKPNFQERIKMKEQGLTWDQLRKKLNVKVYK